MANVHGLSNSHSKESHSTQNTYQHQIKNSQKIEKWPRACLFGSLYSTQNEEVSHVAHVFCHRSSITVFMCGIWSILGLVGKQRQAHFGPYWPLQGGRGFQRPTCLNHSLCWDRLYWQVYLSLGCIYQTVGPLSRFSPFKGASFFTVLQ